MEGVKNALRKSFGLKVRELRLASGVSQETFADLCGFARSYMSRIERGCANPSLDAIGVLADALGVSIGDLLGSVGQTSPKGLVVPFASDGSCFNPELRRAGRFSVGEKATPQYFPDFMEALSFLASMDTAKWRRPNLEGNWGLVSAVKWAPLPDDYNKLMK